MNKKIISAIFAVFALLAFSAVPALAQSGMPRPLGQNGQWTAAAYTQNGQTICYAFTRAVGFYGVNAPLLTVTKRPGQPVEVAISGDVNFTPSSNPTAVILSKDYSFFGANGAFFARRNMAVVNAFLAADLASVGAQGSSGKNVTYQFSLVGFNASYNIVQNSCP